MSEILYPTKFVIEPKKFRHEYKTKDLNSSSNEWCV